MAQKTNKARKKNLENYKKSQKKRNMSDVQLKPFRQVPNWESTDKFEITGAELESLYSYFNFVAPAFTAIQQVFARGIQSGKVQIGYENEDGSAVSDEEIKQYTEKLNEYFKSKSRIENVSEEESIEEPSAKIVDMNGVPAK